MKTKTKKLLTLSLALAMVMQLAFATTASAANSDLLADVLRTTKGTGKEAEGMTTKKVSVKFINKKNEVTSRKMVIYTPDGVEAPMPVIFIPHYPMDPDDAELQRYLKLGCAVASAYNTKKEGDHNGELTSDDLVFNNACLYKLRHMKQFDKQRILLIGGSAGGYMTLMLNALQMGITASVANSPICNIYFNLNQYCKDLQKKPQGKLVVITALALTQFTDNFNDFPNNKDYSRWEAFSPCTLTGDFSSPIVINHWTSDVLVPISQLSRKVAKKPGATMPSGIRYTLPKDNPGQLSKDLLSGLPKNLTKVHEYKNQSSNYKMSYDTNYMFYINVCDDGQMQCLGAHQGLIGVGTPIESDYVKTMLKKTLKNTETLQTGKLLLFLERYQGKSKQLPAHTGVDDTVYGSLAMYRKEIVEELGTYAKNHSKSDLDTAMKKAIATLSGSQKTQYTKTWNQIKAQL